MTSNCCTWSFQCWWTVGEAFPGRHNYWHNIAQVYQLWCGPAVLWEQRCVQALYMPQPMNTLGCYSKWDRRKFSYKWRLVFLPLPTINIFVTQWCKKYRCSRKACLYLKHGGQWVKFSVEHIGVSRAASSLSYYLWPVALSLPPDYCCGAGSSGYAVGSVAVLVLHCLAWHSRSTHCSGEGHAWDPLTAFLCGTPILQGLTCLSGQFDPEAAKYHLEVQAHGREVLF